MSLPVLIGFAGVLVAAVTTGLLAGRAVRQPRIDTIVWTAAALALTVALVAQSMGFGGGFGSATFRAVQLFALLLAPLWLAWGLVEVVWPGEAARFGARLACGALTVVGSVILVTDPLTAAPFGKGWPLAGSHYQAPSHYALDVVQAVAVILAAASIGLAAAQARTEGSWPGTLPGAALVGLAVFLTVGLRFPLPTRSAYPLLSLLAAALVWFGVTRLEAQPGRDRGTGRNGTVGRDQTGSDRMADRDETGRDRSGRERVGRDPGVNPADRYDRRAPYPAEDHDRRRAPYPAEGYDRRAPYPPEDYDRRAPYPAEDYDRRAPYPAEGYDRRAPYPADGYDPHEAPYPANGHRGPRVPGDLHPPGDPRASGEPELPAAPPYGRILIFTLLDDRAADFDRFAEQAAEEVRTREPDTLVYVIHLVPNAPLQRIFYEIYRDRAAFDRHENQPYMQRFVADRRACVLATNVIELRVKYAKVAPLPSSRPPGPPAPPAAAAPPRVPLPPGPLPPGPPHSAPRPQSLEPLPPRPDRRLPSGDRRYGGI
jgi:quinol monooxygenase YgiN